MKVFATVCVCVCVRARMCNQIELPVLRIGERTPEGDGVKY